jgi:hypothetical protein
MATYQISTKPASKRKSRNRARDALRHDWPGPLSERAMAVMRMFGITIDRLRETACSINFELRIKQGDVVYITGPSGAGKSVLLREMEKRVSADKRINLAEIVLPDNRAVIDCFDEDIISSLKLLGIAGLSDAFCVLRRPSELSEGEKWRFRLAVALDSGKKFVFADEFCCGLDRITASVVSCNVRKFAEKHGITFILASSHDDLLADLQPDVLILKELSGGTKVIYR